MTMPITKYSFIVKDVNQLADTIRKAFRIAKMGRPFPVLIDIPKDVTAKKAEYEKENPGVYNREFTHIDEKEVAAAAEMIQASEKPFIFVGGGAILSGASKELKEFVEKTDAPVTDSLMGKGAFPGTDPRYTGMLGMHGTKASNYGVSECDLLVVVGARFSDRVTGNTATFAKNAKILQIDIDPAEMNKNIIIDHCSMSWSTDECASFYGNTNITMQWCILSESLWHSIHEKEAHGYGGIWSGSPATFHHNLLAHHSNRTPRLCGSRYSNLADVEKVDLCINVIYNWTNEGAYGAQGGYYIIMNNYYKLGPASAKDKTHARFFTAYIDDGKNAQDAGVFGYFYVNGNIMDNTCVDLSGEQQKEIASANANNTSSTAFKVKNAERTSSDLLLDMRIDILSDYSFMQSATDAYETVLAYAGAWTCGWKDNEYIIPERDKIDRRIVSETANGTYSTNASKGGGYGLIDSQEDTIEKWDEYITETSSLVDTDKDGIPDGWEIAKGLNPNDASDGAKYNLSAAYTNLEVYLNGLVENTFPASHSK